MADVRFQIGPNFQWSDPRSGKLTREALLLVDALVNAIQDATSDFVLVNAAQTLTQKTLDGDTNTFQDIPATAIKSIAAGVAAFITGGTSATLRGALTDETGTGAAVFGTNPTITKPNVVGTITNDDAAAGSLGELIESEVLAGAAVALSTGTDKTVTSISLTAGDWDVWANVGFSLAGTTTLSAIVGGINTTTDTLPTTPNKGAYARQQMIFTTGVSQEMAVGQRRLSLAATTTVYLVAFANFAVSTCAAYGYIGARRVR